MDLQVAREVVSKNIYELPEEVRTAMDDRQPPLTVLDLGANIGLFTLTAIHMFGHATRVVAVEPDPANVRLLRENLSVNGYDDQVTVHAVAAGRQDGNVRLQANRGDESYVADGGDRVGSIDVPMIDAFSLATGCALVKIDIEGSEWDLLRDPRMRELDAAAVAVEWHVRRSGTEHPAAEMVHLLERAGFETRETSQAVVWGWRPAADRSDATLRLPRASLRTEIDTRGP
jgi:FkbM family methyltransferase